MSVLFILNLTVIYFQMPQLLKGLHNFFVQVQVSLFKIPVVAQQKPVLIDTVIDNIWSKKICEKLF